MLWNRWLLFEVLSTLCGYQVGDRAICVERETVGIRVVFGCPVAICKFEKYRDTQVFSTQPVKFGFRSELRKDRKEPITLRQNIIHLKRVISDATVTSNEGAAVHREVAIDDYIGSPSLSGINVGNVPSDHAKLWMVACLFKQWALKFAFSDQEMRLLVLRH